MKKIVAVFTFLSIMFVFAFPVRGAEFRHRRLSDKQFLKITQKGTEQEFIEALSNDVVNINAHDIEGRTALIYAASRGYVQAVGILLKKGADVNATRSHNWSALMHATLSGHTKIVDMLIKAGADINIKSKSGINALIIASGKNYVDIVNILIKAGIDVNSKKITTAGLL